LSILIALHQQPARLQPDASRISLLALFLDIRITLSASFRWCIEFLRFDMYAFILFDYLFVRLVFIIDLLLHLYALYAHAIYNDAIFDHAHASPQTPTSLTSPPPPPHLPTPPTAPLPPPRPQILPGPIRAPPQRPHLIYPLAFSPLKLFIGFKDAAFDAYYTASRFHVWCPPFQASYYRRHAPHTAEHTGSLHRFVINIIIIFIIDFASLKTLFHYIGAFAYFSQLILIFHHYVSYYFDYIYFAVVIYRRVDEDISRISFKIGRYLIHVITSRP
jgi:hypothetical protein